jgi:hypothetical protein
MYVRECSKLTTVEADAAINAGDSIASNLALVNVGIDLALFEHVTASIAGEEDHGASTFSVRGKNEWHGRWQRTDVWPSSPTVTMSTHQRNFIHAQSAILKISVPCTLHTSSPTKQSLNHGQALCQAKEEGSHIRRRW